MSQVLTHPKAAADMIVFTIKAGKITFDSVPVRTNPAGKAHFTVRNDDPVGYNLRIPFAEFKPYANGPHSPIDEPASGKDAMNVKANDTGTLTYAIKTKAHFPFPKREAGTFRYKYNLYFASEKTKTEVLVDPDLEVSS